MLKRSITQKKYGRYADSIMPYGCLYLNNSGSRWVTRDMRFVLVLPNGERKLRFADCYAAFGNFCVVAYRYQGKRFSGLPKADDGSEVRNDTATGLNALPHIFHDKSAQYGK